MAIMKFSTENLQRVFAEEGKYESFQNLLFDLRNGNDIYDFDENGNQIKLTKKQANKAVQKVLMEVCGLDEEDLKSAKKVKRAVKAHSNELFEIIESDIEFKVSTGLSDDEWFMEFVDNRNVALGDEEEFEIKGDNVLFIIAEISGDHHDLNANCRVRIA